MWLSPLSDAARILFIKLNFTYYIIIIFYFYFYVCIYKKIIKYYIKRIYKHFGFWYHGIYTYGPRYHSYWPHLGYSICCIPLYSVVSIYLTPYKKIIMQYYDLTVKAIITHHKKGDFALKTKSLTTWIHRNCIHTYISRTKCQKMVDERPFYSYCLVGYIIELDCSEHNLTSGNHSYALFVGFTIVL
jgi:hypothetical protein